MANPVLAEQDLKFNENFGTQEIPAGGARLEAPNLSNHPYLSAKEPDLSSVHNGYHYEQFALKKQFWGPEKIKLENGGYIEISPPDTGDQNLPSEKSSSTSPSVES